MKWSALDAQGCLIFFAMCFVSVIICISLASLMLDLFVLGYSVVKGTS